MATVKQYVTQLRARQDAIAVKFGTDISRSDKQTRVLNLSLVSLVAVLIKTLTDKQLLTDGELIATLNAARDDAYNDEPIEPPPQALT